MPMERDLIFLIERSPDGCYTARALVYCESAEGGSSARPDEMAREALQSRIETAEVPPRIRLHMLGDEFVAR